MNDSDKQEEQPATESAGGTASAVPPQEEVPAEPETGEAAASEDPVTVLQAELEVVRAEADKMRDQALRALAEADNTRKRAEREKQDTAKYAISAFARDLLDVAENLHRALAAAPADQLEGNELAQQLAVGVQMTEKQLADAFAKHGLTRIDPKGEPFDPNFHQAMFEIPDATAEPGTVVQVIQAGYVLNERLLKPAMVGIAKGDRPKVVDTQA